MNPIPAKLVNPPVVMGAKGDFVWLIREAEAKDPRNPANTYHFNSFDVLRLENGKIQEHWDSTQRTPQSPVVNYGVSPKAPMAWNTGTLSAEEKKTLAMATEELKDMLQYGIWNSPTKPWTRAISSTTRECRKAATASNSS